MWSILRGILFTVATMWPKLLIYIPLFWVFDFPLIPGMLFGMLYPFLAIVPNWGGIAYFVSNIILWCAALVRSFFMPIDIFIILFYIAFITEFIWVWLPTIQKLIVMYRIDRELYR